MATLVGVFNRALSFYGTFIIEYETERRSYRYNKVVMGQITGGENRDPIELLADPERGLYGFRTPPEPAGEPDPEAHE